MIVYDLSCATGHGFEGWFGSSADFAAQQERGLVSCPVCGSTAVTKAPMAPSVGRKGNQLPAVRPSQVAEPQPASVPVVSAPLPPEAAKMMQALAKLQSQVIANSRWVGDRFAEDARAMHYGEKPADLIHGKATPDEAEALLEEGIAVAPLPFPVVPPEEAN